jgi:hypothetical protein
MAAGADALGAAAWCASAPQQLREGVVALEKGPVHAHKRHWRRARENCQPHELRVGIFRALLKATRALNVRRALQLPGRRWRSHAGREHPDFGLDRLGRIVPPCDQLDMLHLKIQVGV